MSTHARMGRLRSFIAKSRARRRRVCRRVCSSSVSCVAYTSACPTNTWETERAPHAHAHLASHDRDRVADPIRSSDPFDRSTDRSVQTSFNPPLTPLSNHCSPFHTRIPTPHKPTQEGNEEEGKKSPPPIARMEGGEFTTNNGGGGGGEYHAAPSPPRPRREELWMADTASQVCLACLRDFTLTRRRHHCALRSVVHVGGIGVCGVWGTGLGLPFTLSKRVPPTYLPTAHHHHHPRRRRRHTQAGCAAALSAAPAPGTASPTGGAGGSGRATVGGFGW